MLRNADNFAHTLSLLHPSYGVNQPQNNVQNKMAVLHQYVLAAQQRGVKADATVGDLAPFWQAREGTFVDATYASGAYSGTITTGAQALRDLTLEFGDNIATFQCASCGIADISGARVVLRQPLAPSTSYAFQASVPVPTVTAPTPPSTPAAPGAKAPWLMALGSLLLLFGARLSGARRGIALGVGILAWSSPSPAQTSPHCTMLRERAADEAALLMFPRVSVQGYRFPQNGQLNGGSIAGQGYQPRAEVSLSLTDLYKGLHVSRLGDAECGEHTARMEFEGSLGRGDDGARYAGLMAQVALLEEHGAEVRAWVDRAGERFSQRVITLLEWNEMRSSADALDASERRLEAKPRSSRPRASCAPPEGRRGTLLVRLRSLRCGWRTPNRESIGRIPGNYGSPRGSFHYRLSIGTAWSNSGSISVGSRGRAIRLATFKLAWTRWSARRTKSRRSFGNTRRYSQRLANKPSRNL